MRTVLLTLVCLLGTSAAFAQPPGGGLPDNATIFERNDANEDGEITQAEATAAGTALGQNFATFDLNSDGMVVADELDTMRERMAAGGGFGGPGGGPAATAPAPAGDDDDDDADDDEDDDD